MISRMSQREKVLTVIVGIAIGVAVNFFLIKFFIDRYNENRKQLASADSGIDFLRKQESERALWKDRDSWLDASMVAVGDPQVAGRKISEVLRDVAKKHTVTLEAPNIGVPGKQPGHTSLPVRIEATAEWKSMFDFLYDLQAPGEFLVFEQLDVRVDPMDKTRLRASMTLAKWFSN